MFWLTECLYLVSKTSIPAENEDLLNATSVKVEDNSLCNLFWSIQLGVANFYLFISPGLISSLLLFISASLILSLPLFDTLGLISFLLLSDNKSRGLVLL